MKKAFTLSEILIAMLVMGVLAAFLIPAMTKMSPNDKGVLFKKSYAQLSEFVSEMINDETLYPYGVNCRISNVIKNDIRICNINNWLIPAALAVAPISSSTSTSGSSSIVIISASSGGSSFGNDDTSSTSSTSTGSTSTGSTSTGSTSTGSTSTGSTSTGSTSTGSTSTSSTSSSGGSTPTLPLCGLWNYSNITGIPSEQDAFCYLFSQKVNTVGTVNCKAKSDEQGFITTDGVQWIMQKAPDTTTNASDLYRIIIIDVNNSQGPNSSNVADPDRFTIYIHNNGKLILPPTVVSSAKARDYLLNPTKNTK